jgi:CPA2 family monovalent cation:H+ antiporter-2
LANFLIPTSEITHLEQQFREKNYEIFLDKHPERILRPTQIPNIQVVCLRVNADSGKVVGKSLAESDIRKNFGINVLAIGRDGGTIHKLDQDVKIIPNDFLYVMGANDDIQDFRNHIQFDGSDS